ncbi:MAG: hypothetical protein HY216_14520 [Candidatus Rokubacteria bacterium]|nr:hypothetical protein [Candidatus Rokubacteria bacterium]
MRTELRTVDESLRGELRAVDESVRTEIRGNEQSLRKVIRRGDRKSRRHAGALFESLRAEIRQVAEIVALNTEAIAQVRVDVQRDMAEHFGTVGLAFAEVRKDIADLRARS